MPSAIRRSCLRAFQSKRPVRPPPPFLRLSPAEIKAKINYPSKDAPGMRAAPAGSSAKLTADNAKRDQAITPSRIPVKTASKATKVSDLNAVNDGSAAVPCATPSSKRDSATMPTRIPVKKPGQAFRPSLPKDAAGGGAASHRASASTMLSNTTGETSTPVKVAGSMGSATPLHTTITSPSASTSATIKLPGLVMATPTKCAAVANNSAGNKTLMQIKVAGTMIGDSRQSPLVMMRTCQTEGAALASMQGAPLGSLAVQKKRQAKISKETFESKPLPKRPSAIPCYDPDLRFVPCERYPKGRLSSMVFGPLLDMESCKVNLKGASKATPAKLANLEVSVLPETGQLPTGCWAGLRLLTWAVLHGITFESLIHALHACESFWEQISTMIWDPKWDHLCLWLETMQGAFLHVLQELHVLVAHLPCAAASSSGVLIDEQDKRFLVLNALLDLDDLPVTSARKTVLLADLGD
ncbi:hypothetical protein IE81DRAFT_328523 [Ceraceosorus guamensis]|uniref:Uncharacterized protein n=1 Tax=Ceraceosorus guamensis TaxID=1522189 RepID=A0A316W9F6_9BASI|nr:hypothetical protein IE81DRAFT_328523 [Ceraceosorus guamensis]PWN44643.1 hypothetical protein IE81DRAFT_328523 [Ceraceosorus guamensis]